MPQKFQKGILCLKCQQKYHADFFCEIPYSFLIKEHKEKMEKLAHFKHVATTDSE